MNFWPRIILNIPDPIFGLNPLFKHSHFFYLPSTFLFFLFGCRIKRTYIDWFMYSQAVFFHSFFIYEIIILSMFPMCAVNEKNKLVAHKYHFLLLDLLFWASVWRTELTTNLMLSFLGFLVHSEGPPTSTLAFALPASLDSSSAANLSVVIEKYYSFS